jgi:AcrR family transcriptional regulator
MARTRSLSAHQKVLDAALELVAESGVEATSMDAIARKSGVSKATIYKHWTDKDALLLEMMAFAAGLHTRPKFDSGNVRADMIAVLAYRQKENAEVRERLVPHFIAYSVKNHQFGHAWRSMAMETPRKELGHLLGLAIQNGELPAMLDVDLSLALLLGPVIYWHVFLKRDVGDPKGLAEGVVDAFWRAFSIPPFPAHSETVLTRPAPAETPPAAPGHIRTARSSAPRRTPPQPGR